MPSTAVRLGEDVIPAEWRAVAVAATQAMQKAGLCVSEELRSEGDCV